MSSHVALKTVWILISWLLQDLHWLQESLYLVAYCFQKSKLYKHRNVLANLFFPTCKIFLGQVQYGHDLLVLGQVENFTISTPMA